MRCQNVKLFSRQPLFQALTACHDEGLLNQEPVVFVVDDDASVRRALRRLIRSAGLAVEVFATAAEFLEHPGRFRPGCLVLDIRMPGMGGIELQRCLVGTTQELPIVFITGYETQEVRDLAHQAGAVDFLSKPFDDQSLLGAIHRALGQQQTGISAPKGSD
ncbi:MAG: response regulator transcription factor [Acidobacteriota bacterium]